MDAKRRDFNPSRLAPYAVAVLGSGVFLSLLAAWDQPQWPAAISELNHDANTPYGKLFWYAMTVGGLLLLLSRRLEWIKPSFPFIGSRRIEIPVGDISCLAMITIACIPIVPIDQVRTFGHVMQSRIHQTAAVMTFGVLPSAVCHTIFQRLPLARPSDNPNWIIHSRHAISAAAKQTRCLVPFFCAGGALLSFLSWQTSERWLERWPGFGVPHPTEPSIFALGALVLVVALIVSTGSVWSLTLHLSQITVLWSLITGVADVLGLGSPSYIASGIFGVVLLVSRIVSESRDNDLRALALLLPYLLAYSLEMYKAAFRLKNTLSFGCEWVCAVFVLAMIYSLPNRPPPLNPPPTRSASSD